MNRKLYLGIMALFGVIFIISIVFLPYYNPIYFYLQHISLFLFMALFIFGLLKLAYNRLVKRIKNESILRGFTIVVFALLLFGFSNVQLYAIDTYQTPEFQSCFYYDEHYNAIFYSQLVNSCPELEEVVKTDTTLSFKVVEENTGNDDYDYVDGIDLEDIDYTATTITNVELEYDGAGNILESSMTKVGNIKLENGNTIVNIVTTNIHNEIIYDGYDAVRFESYQTTSAVYDILSSFYDPENPTATIEYVKYVSEKTYTENNDVRKNDWYQIVISKEEYDNPLFLNEPIDETVIQQLDFVCDEEECNVYREDFGIPRAQYVSLVENGLADSDKDFRYTISDNEIQIVYPYWFYQDPFEKLFTTVTYSSFKDFDTYVFDSATPNLRNENDINRSSFKYQGSHYIEHGDLYSIVYETNYGYKVVNKISTMEFEQTFEPPIIYSSSIMFDIDSFYRIENIYDYGLRATYDPNNRDEIFYQKNPLVFRLIN